MSSPGEGKTEESQRQDGWHRRLLEHSPEITAVLNADWTVTYVTPAVDRILGYSPDDLTGDRIVDYLHPDDRDAVARTVERLPAEADESRTVKARVRRADGSWCWLESALSNHLDDDEIDGVVVSSRPIAADDKRGADDSTATERMELALEGANLGVWDWNMETGEVSRDELLTEMLGYTPAEMGGHLHDWEALVHPEGEQRHNEALAEHIAERTPYYECEYRMKTNADDWKWVRTMGKVVERDDDGTPLRAVGIHQDIDDRKRAELALKEEREMFTTGPAVVFKWADAEGWPIEYVSENVEDVFGYPSAHLQSERVRFADLVHEADRDRLVAEVTEQRSGANSRINPEPYRVMTADGDVRWVLEHTKIIENASEEGYLLGYLVDITERKQRERDLAERERKYRRLFEDTRDAIMVLDREGYLDCNERTLELFGFDSIGEFREHAPWELAPATQPDGTESRESALSHIDAAFEDGEAFFEWTHRRADGTVFPAEVKLSRFEYEGRPALHALVRDISERKEHEQRIEQQRDNLDILNTVLRHDIRNDLQLIRTYAELIAEDCGDESYDDYVETMLESAEHAVELTQTAGEIADVMLSAESETERVDLKAILTGELEEVRSAYPDAVVTIDGAVPAETVPADSMLASVFRNLLKNAIQHNDKAVPAVTVSVTTNETTVVVRIADNGPGIPPGQREAIFGKGETDLGSAGTGIGLYLVETLVDSYDGSVWVEDNEPAGAVFALELPRVT